MVGSAWLGLAWLGLAWLGLAWLSLAWLGVWVKNSVILQKRDATYSPGCFMSYSVCRIDGLAGEAGADGVPKNIRFFSFVVQEFTRTPERI